MNSRLTVIEVDLKTSWLIFSCFEGLPKKKKKNPNSQVFLDISLCDSKRIFCIFKSAERKCCFLSAYVVSEEASLLHQTSIPCQTCLYYIKYTSLTEIKFLGSLFLPWLSTSLRGLCCIRSKAA